MNQEKLYKLLEQPIISEKSMFNTQFNQYTFKVRKDANKNEIKHAVEKLFEVKVDKVQMMNVKPKPKRFGRLTGQRNGWKKALVKLKEGYEIDITGAQA